MKLTRQQTLHTLIALEERIRYLSEQAAKSGKGTVAQQWWTDAKNDAQSAYNTIQTAFPLSAFTESTGKV